MKRLFNRIYYLVESIFLRGSIYQVVTVAIVIALMSAAGGWAVYLFSPEHTDLSRSIWWAFLRLSDPGYLGDDHGTIPRTVSTVLTFAGYVFVLGSLVAIMTNRLDRFMSSLSSGKSPIFEEDHILIIGWNAQIEALVEEIGHAEERIERRLDRNTLPAVVILTREFDPSLPAELDERLDEDIRRKTRVLIRSGNPLEAESLERVDFRRAASIILVSPIDHRRSRHLSDIQLVKILLSLRAQSTDVDRDDLPNVVLEIGNPANKLLAENAGWRDRTEAIASDEVLSRLIGHTVRNPGLSRVYNRLLTDAHGETLYLRRVSRLDLAGYTLAETTSLFDRAIPIGVLHPRRGSTEREDRLELLYLDEPLEPDDELIFVSSSLAALAPTDDSSRSHSETTSELGTPRRSSSAPSISDLGEWAGDTGRHILFVGWSHLLTPILRELAPAISPPLRATLVTERPPDECRDRLRLDPDRHAHLQLNCVRGQIDHPEAVQRLAPPSLDTVVLLGSELAEDPLMADAETIMAFVQLRQHFDSNPDLETPSFVVELNDEDNRPLFNTGEDHDVIMTQEIIAHLLSQVGTRRALAWIYEDLFTQRGSEIRLRRASELFGRSELPVTTTFARLQARCVRSDTIAIGYQLRAPEGKTDLRLNPPRGRQFELNPDDRVVVVS